MLCLLDYFLDVKKNSNCQFKVTVFTYFLIYFSLSLSLSCDSSRAVKAASLQRTESLAICSLPFFSFPPNGSLLASSSPRSLILLCLLCSDWSPCLNTYHHHHQIKQSIVKCLLFNLKFCILAESDFPTWHGVLFGLLAAHLAEVGSGGNCHIKAAFFCQVSDLLP